MQNPKNKDEYKWKAIINKQKKTSMSSLKHLITTNDKELKDSYSKTGSHHRAAALNSKVFISGSSVFA